MKVNFYLVEHVNGSLQELMFNLPIFSYDSDMLVDTKKWSPLLAQRANLVPKNYVRLSELAEVRKGTATGSNQYFHVSMETATKHDLLPFLKPCIGRIDNYVKFSDTDFNIMVEKEKPCFLVCLPSDIPNSFPYIQRGLSAGEDEKYINSHRKPWFMVRHVQPAPILAGTFVRGTPRFIRNLKNAINLTTYHGVYPKLNGDSFADVLAVCLNAPLPQQLMRSQMRSYSNGLYKFEPSDMLDIMVPDLCNISETAITLIAEYLRIWSGKDYSDFPWNEIENILEIKITT